MKGLNSIAKMEEFIVNSLLASPDIPLDVNVLRLADVPDKEGTVIFPKSITVRYTGSNTEIMQREPLLLERTLDFTLEISCQNNQSTSGHDYATYLLGACSAALLNRVPRNTGDEVIEPLSLGRDSFQGLTDSSHFVYQQDWSLVVKNMSSRFSPDPCVSRGNCGRLFPPGTNTSVLQGEVLLGNRVYHLKPSEGKDCQKFGGVIPNEAGDLVTIEDNGVVYLSSEQREAGVTYISKSLEGTEDILVTVRLGSGEILRSDLYCFTGRTVLSILGFLTNQGELPDKIFTLKMPYAQKAVIVNGSAVAYLDPTDSEEKPLQMKYGNLVLVDESITLNVAEETYTKAYIPDFNGEGWVTNGTFQFLYDLWECEDEL